MKRICTILVCLVIIYTVMGQSPMTPREAMALCSMVDPLAHIANNFNTPDAFIKRNNTLNDQVMAWASQQMENLDPDFDPVKAQKQSDRKRDKMMKRVQQIDPQKQMAAIQRMMADMKAYYKLSDKDMEKVMNMNDRQAEAFFVKRAKELGVELMIPDPSKYGAVMLERDEKEDALADKRVRVKNRSDELEKIVQNFKNRYDVVMNIINALETTAKEKCDAELEKWYDKYAALPRSTGLGGGLIDPEREAAFCREASDALIRFEQQTWVAPVREQLIGLLADAEAADAANAECLKLWLSVTDDAMARQGLMQKYNHVGLPYAVAIFGLYRKVTQGYCKFVPKRGCFN